MRFFKLLPIVLGLTVNVYNGRFSVFFEIFMEIGSQAQITIFLKLTHGQPYTCILIELHRFRSVSYDHFHILIYCNENIFKSKGE